ncbi:MAG: antitoxin VapB family protein [Candidatus Aenigmarchaeota archaeon]|nr:antitoxin VapB family protein [Candidatus Aenigmarchaeota archaeon]
MTTKTITIIEDAYNRLKKEKENDESFSDVIIRITEKRSVLKDSFGKWETNDKEMNKISDELKDSWKRFGNHENRM